MKGKSMHFFRYCIILAVFMVWGDSVSAWVVPEFEPVWEEQQKAFDQGGLDRLQTPSQAHGCN
ncbi:MAG: hypothetical protein R6U68_09825 [Desulfobacteraceae bacterium]